MTFQFSNICISRYNNIYYTFISVLFPYVLLPTGVHDQLSLNISNNISNKFTKTLLIY